MKGRYVFFGLLLLGILAGMTVLWSQKQSPAPTASEGYPILSPHFEGLLFNGESVSQTEAQARLTFKLPSLPSHDVQEIWVSKAAVVPAARAFAILYSDGAKLTIEQMTSSPNWEGIIETTPEFTLVVVNGNSGMGTSPGSQEIRGNQYPYPGSVSWWQNGLKITLYSNTMTLDELLVLAESLQW